MTIEKNLIQNFKNYKKYKSITETLYEAKSCELNFLVRHKLIIKIKSKSHLLEAGTNNAFKAYKKGKL